MSEADPSDQIADFLARAGRRRVEFDQLMAEADARREAERRYECGWPVWAFLALSPVMGAGLFAGGMAFGAMLLKA